MTFFQQIIRRVMAFMSGRNGIDTLAFASLAVSLALQMIGSVTGTGLLLLLSLALYGWTLFRVFSRKTYKRQEENRRFVLWWGNAKTKTRQLFLRIKNMREYKYFKCPQCGALLRQTRGGGEKEICCPRCQHRFRQKS